MNDLPDEDIAIDASGYTGKFHREKIDERKLIPMNFEDLIEVFKFDNQILEIMKRIKEIDREHNGYVTSTELTDILHIAYPILKNRNIN